MNFQSVRPNILNVFHMFLYVVFEFSRGPRPGEWQKSQGLSLLRKDELFTPARQKELELTLDLSEVKSPTMKNRMCVEPVAPHGNVKFAIAGHLGRGSPAMTINKLCNTAALPFETGCALAREIMDCNEVAWAVLHKGMITGHCEPWRQK